MTLFATNFRRVFVLDARLEPTSMPIKCAGKLVLCANKLTAMEYAYLAMEGTILRTINVSCQL